MYWKKQTATNISRGNHQTVDRWGDFFTWIHKTNRNVIFPSYFRHCFSPVEVWLELFWWTHLAESSSSAMVSWHQTGKLPPPTTSFLTGWNNSQTKQYQMETKPKTSGAEQWSQHQSTKNCSSSNGHLRLQKGVNPQRPPCYSLVLTNRLVSRANFPVHDNCTGVNFI